MCDNYNHWIEDTGIQVVRGYGDIERGMHTLIENGKIKDRERSKRGNDGQIREIWNLSNSDPQITACAVGTALKAGAGFAYIKTVLRNGIYEHKRQEKTRHESQPYLFTDPRIAALDYKLKGIWYGIAIFMAKHGPILQLEGEPLPIRKLAKLINAPREITKKALEKFVELGVLRLSQENGWLKFDQGVAQNRPEVVEIEPPDVANKGLTDLPARNNNITSHITNNLDSANTTAKIVPVENAPEPEGDICTTILDRWNEIEGVRPALKITKVRREEIKARLKEGDWPWDAALAKFPLRCFSRNDVDDWLPTLDWFLKPEMANNILEGKYDFVPDAKKRRPPPGGPKLATAEDKLNYNPYAR